MFPVVMIHGRTASCYTIHSFRAASPQRKFILSPKMNSRRGGGSGNAEAEWQVGKRGGMLEGRGLRMRSEGGIEDKYEGEI